MFFHVYLLTAFFIAAPSLIHCAPSQGPYAFPKDFSNPLSIPELLDIALSNHPETHSAWWNAQRAVAVFGNAKSAYYPRIDFQGSIAHGLDYRFIKGSETNYTTASADVTLSYLLFDFGERKAASQWAKEALGAANWQSNWTMQKVMQQVIHNAYSLLNVEEQLNSRMETLLDAHVLSKAAEELQRTGLRSINDIYTIKAVISEMEMAIVLQNAEVTIARAKLSASLGLSAETELVVAPLPDPHIDSDLQENLASLTAYAYQMRSDLMAKRAELQQKMLLRDQANQSYLPKVRLNADTGYRRYLHDKANGFNYNVGLYLEAPLFNGFETIYQNRLALSEVRLSEVELERLELEIALDVLTCSCQFQAAQKIIVLAGENLQNSLKTYEGVLDKYKIGTQSIFELIAAQKLLAEARIKQGDAKIRWYRSLAQLAYATGSLSREGACIASN